MVESTHGCWRGHRRLALLPNRACEANDEFDIDVNDPREFIDRGVG